MKKNNVTMENLAVMIKEGFDGMDDKIDKEINGVKGEINGVKGEINGVNRKLDVLERGQEEIKLRLSNVAYPAP